MDGIERALDCLVTDDAEAGLFRVQAAAFTDPRFFALEKERVLKSMWLYPAHESELNGPNTFVSRKVGDKLLIDD